MAAKTRVGKIRDSYLEFVLAFPLASIKSEQHLDMAQRVMDKLLAKRNSMTARKCTSTLSAILLELSVGK